MSSYRFLHNSLLIAPSALRRSFLAIKKENPHLNFSMMSLNKLIDSFFYLSDERVIAYFLAKGVSYDLAKEYQKVVRSPFLDRSMTRLSFLKEDQELLLKQGILGKDEVNALYFKRPILIAGYQNGTCLSRFLGEIHSAMAIGYCPYKNTFKKHPVFSFADAYDELHYVYNRIAKLLDSGVKADDIYLYGVNDQYRNIMQFLQGKYGFCVDLNESEPLRYARVYQEFRRLYKEGETEIFDKLNEGYAQDPSYIALKNFLISWEQIEAPYYKDNRLAFYDDLALDSMVDKSFKIKNAIQILQEPYIPHNAHIFVLGFSLDSYPRLFKDNSFLSKKEKKELGYQTGEEKSEEENLALRRLLTSNAVEAISFSEIILGKANLLSSLANDLSLEIIKDPVLEYEYASDKGAFYFAGLYDDYYLYHIDNERYRQYLEYFKPHPFYRSDYQKIEGYSLNKNEYRYSYTSIEKYYSCPFSYYLEKILKLSESEPSLNVSIGLVVHKYFEHLAKGEEKYRYLDALKEFLDEHPETKAREKMILESIASEIEEAYSWHYKHLHSLPDSKFYSEKEFTIPLEESEDKIFLTGRYDLLVTFDPNALLIVDYKTGNAAYSEEKFEDGTGLQLPLYAAYALEDENFSTREISGLFIATLLRKLDDRAAKKPFNLNGLFSNEREIITPLVSLDESYVSGFKINKVGAITSTRHNCLTAAEFSEKAKASLLKVLEAHQLIKSGAFEIKPSSDACRFCTFMDICYRKKGEVKSKENDEEEEEK